MKNPFKRKKHHPEHTEQVLFIHWAVHQEKLPVFAIPNGGHRHKQVAKMLKAEGVRPGVPDLFLPLAYGGHFGLFIEMKANDGKLSTDQLEWCKRLSNDGYCVIVPQGHKVAIEAVKEYLSLAPTVPMKVEPNEKDGGK